MLHFLKNEQCLNINRSSRGIKNKPYTIMKEDKQQVKVKRVKKPKAVNAYFADFGVRRQRKHRLDIEA